MTVTVVRDGKAIQVPVSSLYDHEAQQFEDSGYTIYAITGAGRSVIFTVESRRGEPLQKRVVRPGPSAHEVLIAIHDAVTTLMVVALDHKRDTEEGRLYDRPEPGGRSADCGP